MTSPYGNLRENLPALLDTGIEALHLDLVSTLYDAEDADRLQRLRR